MSQLHLILLEVSDLQKIFHSTLSEDFILLREILHNYIKSALKISVDE